MRWQHDGGFVADDEAARVDVEVVHGFINTSYWASGLPREVMVKAIAGSLNMGVYDAAGAQVAYARAVTDRATFAWIADVFVLESHRGHGLGRFVVSTLLDHPELQGLRRMMLATADAHGLYRSYGFNDLPDPSRLLVIQRDIATLYAPNSATPAATATSAVPGSRS
ncbi:GNAT family N-acetyltransferase [Streptomyces sp. SID13031]|uniref:GNAT family N-acetyltransferase n=1 Tax=Streptomyces sp. SID13031 TaxID=2706046 RepID=UPI0013CA2C08|nr:GNAT family N-acetyltransferase [Streptomyces sp. SID13031]NEA34139.1 GNAT family N-acetyltransferase [Streptomyces sp. SID13031]